MYRGHDENDVGFDGVEDGVRKAPHHCLTDTQAHDLVPKRAGGDSVKRGAKLAKKLQRQHRAVALIPGQGFVHIKVSLSPNNDPI
jgi:hypothetical protein